MRGREVGLVGRSWLDLPPAGVFPEPEQPAASNRTARPMAVAVEKRMERFRMVGSHCPLNADGFGADVGGFVGGFAGPEGHDHGIVRRREGGGGDQAGEEEGGGKAGHGCSLAWR